ncbi:MULTISPECIES: hypothetical protein [Olivibacter]|uniref:Uncharacterized protein n=1 Tax=Olivibacter jilunii TaxID=985016 RepID=A0ABW6AZK4_9SPHI
MEIMTFGRLYIDQIAVNVNDTGVVPSILYNVIVASRQRYGSFSKDFIIAELETDLEIRKAFCAALTDYYYKDLQLKITDIEQERDLEHFLIEFRINLPDDISCIKIIDENNLLILDRENYMIKYTVPSKVKLHLRGTFTI